VVVAEDMNQMSLVDLVVQVEEEVNVELVVLELHVKEMLEELEQVILSQVVAVVELEQ
jgi:hypothetical protein|tara:strand:- start:226 stop:399 length:174 start_codon:yes stop_codon:yes gene_type:complete